MVNTEIRLNIFSNGCEYIQSNFGVDHLVMSMCRVFFELLEDGVFYNLCVLFGNNNPVYKTAKRN